MAMATWFGEGMQKILRFLIKFRQHNLAVHLERAKDTIPSAVVAHR